MLYEAHFHSLNSHMGVFFASIFFSCCGGHFHCCETQSLAVANTHLQTCKHLHEEWRHKGCKTDGKMALTKVHTSAKARQSPIVLNHRYQPHLRSMLYFTIKEHVNKNTQICNVEDSEKHTPRSVHLPAFTPKINGDFSGLRPILKFRGNQFSSFCVSPLTYQQMNGHGWKHNLLDGGKNLKVKRIDAFGSPYVSMRLPLSVTLIVVRSWYKSCSTPYQPCTCD